ncbi:MAG: hypothetical protein OER82_08680 [Nitrosopumilus sp.]|nr:hypothetical protein [Nitrosopumilus sp.]
MSKKLHNQERSSRKGILTENEKKTILDNSISSRNIRELISTKTKRSLTQRLNAISKDLELIFNNERFYLWYTDIYTHDALNKIQGKIYQHFEFQEFPEYKISATYTDGKRRFVLKPININKDTKGNMKKERIQKITRGLKENEKKIILKYVKINGFNFPLEMEKEYSWKEVNKILKNKIKEKQKKNKENPKIGKENPKIGKENPKIGKEIVDELNDRLNKANKMINSKISKKEHQKIIKETGFGIKLIQYTQSL